jgi:hypothetical protein
MLTFVYMAWKWLNYYMRYYQFRRGYREAVEYLIDILERFIEETRRHTLYSTVL